MVTSDNKTLVTGHISADAAGCFLLPLLIYPTCKSHPYGLTELLGEYNQDIYLGRSESGYMKL